MLIGCTIKGYTENGRSFYYISQFLDSVRTIVSKEDSCTAILEIKRMQIDTVHICAFNTSRPASCPAVMFGCGLVRAPTAVCLPSPHRLPLPRGFGLLSSTPFRLRARNRTESRGLTGHLRPSRPRTLSESTIPAELLYCATSPISLRRTSFLPQL
jgi:hypothetical protein